jgi:hypothetical protein
MINPSELRFGNYVIVENYNSKYWNKIGKVEGFTRNAEYVSLDINQNSAFYLKDIEPIPLTEEILIKCGFEKPDRGCFQYKGIRLTQIRDLYFRGNFPIKADIKYLHQLQNLVFSLLNEELTIKI